MQYSLGNMLKGGGALNPDGLALDLAFALDRSFTTDPAAPGGALITSRRGPAAKFSRGSGATQVNAAGLIEYAPENLLVRSSELSSATWSRTTVGLPAEVVGAGPSGESAWQLQPSGSNSDIGQSIIIPSGGSTYTFSVWLKSDTGSNVSLQLNVYDNIAATLRGSKSITVTSEWQRFEVSSSALVSGNSTRLIIGAFASWSTGENLLAFGAQLERAITARTYYPTTSSAFYGPRFDHDPATGDCKGLLIEESRTNLLTYSEDMTVANGWNEDTNAGTVAWSNNATTSPSGLVTAEKLTEASTTSARRITVKSVVTVVGTTYTLSVYAKASERSILQIASSAGFTTVTQNFDLTNVALGTGDATGPSIVSVGSGWYRCSIQVVSSATGSSLFAFGMVPAATSGRFAAYTGVVGNGLFLWGAQLEVGTFPTSYIPTTSGTAARSADVCSIVGDAFASFYNQSEGTLDIDYKFDVTLTALAGVAAISQHNYAQAIQFNRLASSVRNTFNSAGAPTLTLNATLPVLTATRNAFALKDNDSAQAVNGVIANTDTTLAIPKSMATLVLGANGITGGAGFQTTPSATISRVTYYRKRLSNAKLQTLTAP